MTTVSNSKDVKDIVTLLKLCAKQKNLCKGTRLHVNIIKDELFQNGCNMSIANSLVSMYAKCGALERAARVLDTLPIRNTVTWNALISGYAQQGKGLKALKCFGCMELEGVCPDVVTFICISKACGSLGATIKAEQIHEAVLRQGLLGQDVNLGSTLVDMFVKCGAVAKAQQVLDILPVRDVVSWNALIGGYARDGRSMEALSCFEQMQNESIFPDSVTFLCMLKVFASMGAVDKGKQIHCEIVRHRLLERNVLLGNALVDMYAKCNVLGMAHQLLNELPLRNVASWSALITGFVQQGQGEEALNCFEQMQQEGLTPDEITFTCILKACSGIGKFDQGKKIHLEILKQGLLQISAPLLNALIDMYVRFGALVQARQVLKEFRSRDVVSWSSLIAGHVQQGQGQEALNCFDEMKSEGLFPDGVTYMCILKACGDIGALDKGKHIHDELARQGFFGKDIVLRNVLADMYAECGALSKAQELLDELDARDVVAWSALLGGYVKHGNNEGALNCFDCMLQEGVSPNAVTFITVLKACSLLGSVHKGKRIHDEVLIQGLGNDLALGNALIDMYARCGLLVSAQHVLNELACRDIVSWNALIAGYAHQGKTDEALNCLECIQQDGLLPNAMTMSSILNSFCHSGFLQDGQNYFAAISKRFSILPNLEHYSCMVDLLVRAGNFEKALAIIEKMPTSGHLPSWAAIIGACQKWGNLKIARLAFNYAIQVDNYDAGNYVCLNNIYASAKMQEVADDKATMEEWCHC